jgi:hypothetical protein
MTAHNRFPWTPAEEATLIQHKRAGTRHKIIARELQRTPRAVDQQVARMREHGKLATHRREEMDLLEKVEAEALQPERYPHQ